MAKRFPLLAPEVSIYGVSGDSLTLIAQFLLATIAANIYLLYRYITHSREGTLATREPNVLLTQILIHPIKSCRGLSVQEARYTPEGLEYDRKWVIIDAKTHKFVTAREQPKMVLITPTVHRNASSDSNGELEVAFPQESDLPHFRIPLEPTEEQLRSFEYIEDVLFWQGARLDGYVVESSESLRSPSDLISSYLGFPVLLVMKGPVPRAVESTFSHPDLKAVAQFQDGYPLFVATAESLADLQSKVSLSAKGEDKQWAVGRMDPEKWRDGRQLNIERFRPNLFISGVSRPWVEDTWAEILVGDELKAGGKVTLVSKGTRCLLPNVDTSTGVRDAAVPYKVMGKFRGVDPATSPKPCFGVNGVPQRVTGGVFKVGDRVVLTRMLNKAQILAKK